MVIIAPVQLMRRRGVDAGRSGLPDWVVGDGLMTTSPRDDAGFDPTSLSIELASMGHRVSIVETGQGRVQAVCSWGWRSLIFGADKTGGTMDALQRGVDAGDLHQWGASLR